MVEQPTSKRERWKSRFREIGNIVLGVLIALGLGAIASEIGWQIEVANARSALADELGEIIGQAKERERANQCIERKLDSIGAILDEAERSSRLPPVGAIGEPMFRTWSTGVWESTLSSQIASHMDREALDNLSGAYHFIDNIKARTIDEVDAWTEMYSIVGPGRNISSEEIQDLRRAVSSARTAHRLILVGGIRVDQIATAYDLPVNQDSVTDHSTGTLRRYCSPIAPPAGETYGSAPFSQLAQLARDNPILD